MTIEEILDKAYKVYPVSPGGFFCDGPSDANEDLRFGYIRGYEDALKEMEEKK